MKNRYTWNNVYSYIQGKVRERLFYSEREWVQNLLPLHVYEQINYRLFRMDKTCYALGRCVSCGCETPSLQMANKACDKACYPEMLPDWKWEAYKRVHNITFYYWRLGSREFDLRIEHKTIKR